MKLFSLFKSNKFLLPLIIITILCGIIYYVWNKREGIDTDSTLITTTNPLLFSQAVTLGTTNSVVSQYKQQINSQLAQLNNMFDSNGTLKPESVQTIFASLKQAAKTINPSISEEQINSMITPALVQQYVKKNNIKTFLDNVIDLATLVKQGLN